MMDVRKGGREGKKIGRREIRNQGRERGEEERDRGKHGIRLRQGSKERSREDGLDGERRKFWIPQFQRNYWTFHCTTIEPSIVH